MTKEACIKKLFREYCREFEGREFVSGSGCFDCELMLIGEAPGKDEVRLSRPFVGKAGGYLDEFLGHLGIARDSIYITNAIKYRLSKTDPRTGRVSNRPARSGEIAGSRRCLLEEIDIIKPDYIVTLGNVPLKAVTGESGLTVGSLHGKVNPVNIMERDYRLYALYHPASIIYNRSLKDIYIEDVKRLKSVISGRVG